MDSGCKQFCAVGEGREGRGEPVTCARRAKHPFQAASKSCSLSSLLFGGVYSVLSRLPLHDASSSPQKLFLGCALKRTGLLKALDLEQVIIVSDRIFLLKENVRKQGG